MPQDPVAIWKSTFSVLPFDYGPGPAAGANNIADWMDERVTNKLILSGPVTFTPNSVFTWSKDMFKAALLALVPTSDPIIPRTKIALAWKNSVLASTMVLPAGTQVAPPPPPANGIYAGPPVIVINPVDNAYNALVQGLLSMGFANTALESGFPNLFHDAFFSLTYSITGVDTTPPSSGGPYPMNFPIVNVR